MVAIVGNALIGYGPHGKDVEAIWMRRWGKVPMRLFDDHPRTDIVRPIDEWKGEHFLIGVNDPTTRRALHERLDAEWPDNVADPLIDPSAVVGHHSTLRPGCVVGPHATLLRSVHLGSHVHVHYGAQMTRCEVGHFTTISPGAVICGDVTIGDQVFIGAGAVIKNRVNIGDGAVIAMGAVVVHDVEAGATVRGVPAR